MTEFHSFTEGMTQEELAELATSCLERLEPGRQPLPLFTQMARLVVTSTVEMVPFMPVNENPKVLLAKRSDDDPWWPGQWHLPGTVLLPTDAALDVHDYGTPVDRLFKDEFHGSIVRDGPVTIFDAQRRSWARGSEQTVFGWSRIDLARGSDEVSGGELFNAEYVENELAGESVIDGHLSSVKRALRHYRS
jgi:hypothetical protein